MSSPPSADSTDMTLDDVRLTSHDIADDDPGVVVVVVVVGGGGGGGGGAFDETGSWLGTDGRAAAHDTTHTPDPTRSNTNSTASIYCAQTPFVRIP